MDAVVVFKRKFDNSSTRRCTIYAIKAKGAVPGHKQVLVSGPSPDRAWGAYCRAEYVGLVRHISRLQAWARKTSGPQELVSVRRSKMPRCGTGCYEHYQEKLCKAHPCSEQTHPINSIRREFTFAWRMFRRGTLLNHRRRCGRGAANQTSDCAAHRAEYEAQWVRS
jgi:hypothetical protein